MFVLVLSILDENVSKMKEFLEVLCVQNPRIRLKISGTKNK